jgi:ABC-2 type transport system permease protein
MTNPLLYDVKRVLTSKSVIVLMALIIVLSLALLSAFSVSTNQEQTFVNTQVLSWYDSGGSYHFLALAWNANGQPVSGVSFQVNLTQSEATGSTINCPSATSYSATGATNANGVANFSLSAPISPNYSACVVFTQANGLSMPLGPFPSPYVSGQIGVSSSLVPPGQIVSLGYGGPVQIVNTGSFSQGFIAAWAGSYGAAPTNYTVYYQFINNTQTLCTGQSCTETINFTANGSQSSMQYLATMTGYIQNLPLPPIPANINASTSSIAIGMFYPNGTAVATIASYLTQQFYAQSGLVSVSTADAIVLGFFQGIFGLFIPLIAILGSYNSYGKDRVSGVLESVLAQPVSRRGLSLSRFVSSFVAMAIAISIAMGVVDAIFYYYTHTFFDANLLLISAGAFFVELAAFIALMMFFSRILKSSGALVGLGIGLFLLFALFWSLIVDILAFVVFPQAGFGTQAYNQIIVAGEFLNPAEFVSLVDAYVLHSLSAGGLVGGGFGSQISPADYGITIFSLVAAALLWIGVPLAAFLYLAIKRD